jgi:hypothetical protein
MSLVPNVDPMITLVVLPALDFRIFSNGVAPMVVDLSPRTDRTPETLRTKMKMTAALRARRSSFLGLAGEAQRRWGARPEDGALSCRCACTAAGCRLCTRRPRSRHRLNQDGAWTARAFGTVRRLWGAAESRRCVLDHRAFPLVAEEGAVSLPPAWLC